MSDFKTLRLESGDFSSGLSDVLRAGGCVPLIVTGSSMLPFLRSGRDTVWLCQCDESSFRRGKILLFRSGGGKLVLHRIRKRLCGQRLLMNGDAQKSCEVIDSTQAIAAVKWLTWRGRRFSADSFPVRIRDALWYPTRPFRGFLFRTASYIRRKSSPAKRKNSSAEL